MGLLIQAWYRILRCLLLRFGVLLADGDKRIMGGVVFGRSLCGGNGLVEGVDVVDEGVVGVLLG